MTAFSRFYSFFSQNSATVPPTAHPVTPTPLPIRSVVVPLPESVGPIDSLISLIPEVRPHWLSDSDSLRDEGVLFGLSDAQPDEKVAEITAYFRQQVVMGEVQREQRAETVTALNRLIRQREAEMNGLQKRIEDLTNSDITGDGLIRHTVRLLGMAAIVVGTFILIDDALYPVFTSHWIAIGVFLAGIFNLSGRTSFFYEEGSALTGRQVIKAIGLPFAASVFVLTHALSNQSIAQSTALFVFTFFVFLLAGKVLSDTGISLENDLSRIRSDKQQAADRKRHLPDWERHVRQLTGEIDDLHRQLREAIMVGGQAEATVASLNAQRDQLVNLFLSEFELARSLRYRLSEQQRQAIIHR
ncbi:hypothetical protein [Spirosoma utsteinense]|uniref:Uncharacterized protein n=1 Tax=Spirosoma utsteinense TaxID=2585773 RepID=A0ABR6W5J3_9BACT|nr:hypothetical protein [Spirosoma utsteinense]MBC3786253.1 hypothetical protein [Spirosoma utsteinense]MBC3791879.1 hypothetical protein [Spirosoma utsteinense]